MRYELVDCPSCGGWGMVSGYDQDFIGAVECTRCHGTGKRRRRCEAPEAVGAYTPPLLDVARVYQQHVEAMEGEQS